MFNWIRTYLFSLRRDFAILLGGDLLFLLVMELWLRNIPAPYPVFVRIGDLMVTLTQLLGLKMKEMSEEAIKEKAKHIDLYTEAPLTIGSPKGDHRANWLKANRKVLNAGKMKPERVEKFKKLLEMTEQYRRKNLYE